MNIRLSIKPGDLVSFITNNKKIVGTVIEMAVKNNNEDYVCISYNENWYLRSTEDINLLTINEKVLYMLEHGTQCK